MLTSIWFPDALVLRFMALNLAWFVDAPWCNGSCDISSAYSASLQHAKAGQAGVLPILIGCLLLLESTTKP